MKNKRILCLILVFVITLLLVSCDGDGEGKKDYVRPVETYEGVQGIALRTDVVPDANVFDGTYVTDVILPAANADQIANVKGENDVNVWLSVEVVKPDDATLSAVKAAVEAKDVYGIELDFRKMETTTGSAYNDISVVNEFMSGVVEAVGAKKGMKLSAVVLYDVNSSYNIGLDIASWIALGYLDVVVPSSGCDIAYSDIPVRMWSALADPYEVTVMPLISQVLKGYDADKQETNQTFDTLVGEAANFLSQGADKLCVGDWVESDALKVLGSYETVMTYDRVHTITYSAVKASWAYSNAQLPRTLQASMIHALRFPLGNVPEGSELTIKLRLKVMHDVMPTVYANSEECEFIGIDADNENIICYRVPTGAHDNGYIIAEVKGAQGVITVMDSAILEVDVPQN